MTIKKTPKDKYFSGLKILDHSDMYDLVEKFIQNLVLTENTELTIIKGIKNLVGFPKLPFILLHIIESIPLPNLETHYINRKKIFLGKSKIIMNILFFGNEQIGSIELAQSFDMRFNRGWASCFLAQHNKSFLPIYSDNLNMKPMLMNFKKQYEDKCSIDAYFELSPEIICSDSAI